MADMTIEQPVAPPTDDTSFRASSVPKNSVSPNPIQSGHQVVSDPAAAGYPAHHSDTPLPSFDPKTFTPLGKMAPPPATPASSGTPASNLPAFDKSTFKPLGSAGTSTQTSGHPEPPAARTNVGVGSVDTERLQNVKDVGTGFVKGAGQTINSISGLLNKIPYVGETLAPKVGIQAAKQIETPTNTAQKVGVTAEGIAEFFAGDEALKGLSVAQRLGIAGKIAEYAKTNPVMAKMLEHASTSGRQGVTTVAQQLAHGASVGDAVKTGAEAAGLGTAVGAVAEGVPAAYKTVGKNLRPQALQEPFQGGVRGVLDQTAKDANIGGPPPDMKYTHDQTGQSGNLEHRVVTTDAQGNKIGELAAQDKGDTVTVRSNQVYDPRDRGRGYGKAQIQHLLDQTQASGKKFVQSDISTTPDAQRVWRKLEEEHPDAITHKDIKPKVAEGQPEPLGSKTVWTADLSKYQPPAAGPLKASSQAPSASIRTAASDLGDKVMAESKADYEALDEATNGRFQRFRDKLEAGRRQLRDAITTEDEAPILKKMKETEDEMKDAFAEAKAKGVDPKLIDRADANFKKANALYDLDNHIKKSTTGAHPGISHPDLIEDQPETLDPKKFHRRMNDMYDSGRLQEAIGETNANKLFDHTLEHSGAYDKIMRNRKLAMYGTAGAAGALGGGGYVAHRLAGVALGQ